MGLLEAAETGASVTKAEYAERSTDLRVELLNAQFDLQDAGFAVLVLIMGDDVSAMSEIVDLLHEWMDARHIPTQVFDRLTDEELERPRFWRYWVALPAKGKIGLYLGAWALNAVAERAAGILDENDFERRIERIRRFEQTLVDDGALLIKIWLHVPKAKLRKRLEKAKKHPGKEWVVDERDWSVFKRYDDLVAVAERYLHKTEAVGASWTIVATSDTRHRNLTVATTILDALVQRLQRPEPPEEPPASPHVASVTDISDRLQAVNLTSRVEPDQYRERLDQLQARMNKLARKASAAGKTGVLVFEGWDAAGKGGVIRRITSAIAAKDYRLVSIAAPTEEERAHHYLWRFWRQIPRAGRLVIFDRSWYGRVLVERVEGLAREEEWRRAYAEINDFEENIVEHGIGLLKFWLHIDPDEQLRRFEARENTPYKKYKITEEDYRNRDKWREYEVAVNEMVARTSTDVARWHLIPANDKKYARLEVLDIVCNATKRALKRS